MTGHFPQQLLAAWKADERARRFGSGTGTAGVEYPALAEGRWDFVLYWRTFPWDHVPGTLLVVESGGRAARPDGGPYRASDARAGLLSTARGINWTDVRKVLSPLDTAHGVSRRPF
jgi:fructose-1,6-bisphosphatase/inositol monophosphatase family enzyme